MAKWQQERSFWTWGYRSDEPSEADRRNMAEVISKRFDRVVTPPPIPKLDDIELKPARVKVPGRLAGWVNTEHRERALHTHGGHPLEL